MFIFPFYLPFFPVSLAQNTQLMSREGAFLSENHDLKVNLQTCKLLVVLKGPNCCKRDPGPGQNK